MLCKIQNFSTQQNNYQYVPNSIFVELLDYLIKQDDQISISMPECDNINTDGQEDESNSK